MKYSDGQYLILYFYRKLIITIQDGILTGSDEKTYAKIENDILYTRTPSNTEWQESGELIKRLR